MFPLKKVPVHVCILLVFLLLTCCLEPFNARISPGDNDILVVEGYINAGEGKTTIRLSHVTPLGEPQKVMSETDAVVTIEDDQDHRYQLSEINQGIYESPDLNLPLDRKYRLYLRLKDGEELRSDFQSVKATPPIDSISWESDTMVKIFVNAHDLENNTLYYQWEFEETWQIRSPYESKLKWEDDTVKERLPEEAKLMYDCWKSSKSSELYLTSTEALSRDVVKYELKHLPLGAEQTQVKYSILVRQHTLTKEDYAYLRLMLKNTTEMGGFFDPMPSQLYGNIKSLSYPAKPVVGYVGVYTTKAKRVFILPTDLPSVPVQQNCQSAKVRQTDRNAVAEFVKNYIPTSTYFDEDTNPWMTGMERSCLDCRVYGSSDKPPFW